MKQLALLGCQRWRGGRARYRPAGELFDARRAGVEPIEERQAKRFIESHHYSASYPAARMRAGLFIGPDLVGVAVFSVPMNQGVIPKHFGTESAAGVELGRLVLLDEVAANGESWFVSRAFKAMRRQLPEVRGIVAYSDPLERVDAQGRVVKRGHIGTVYQATNSTYLGRTKPGSLILSRDGRAVHPRGLSKLRNDERGAGYVYDQLRALGAPDRTVGESGPEYIARALREGGFRKLPHPGNHIYAWWLGDGRRRPQWVQYDYPKGEKS